MKRINNLYPQIYSFENLLQAYKKAKKGTKTKESIAFEFHAEKELLQLADELKNHTYKPSPYRFFTIYEPKEREISVASFRDRIVHHAIVTLLEPIYENLFIDHSYATRKNKGTHKAIFQAQSYLQKNKWFLKCDIKKYFANINHQLLINQINSKIKDKELVHLISIIIQNAGNEKSLPIGNLTSQFFANIYLNEFDHFVKRELKCEYYIRYMDDFVIFSSDKEILKTYKTKIKEFLTTLHLTINESHSFLNQTLNGLSFLGVRIFKKLIRIKKENLKRSLNNLKASKYLLAKLKITYEAYYNSVNSIFAHLQNYSTHLFLQKELQKGYLV